MLGFQYVLFERRFKLFDRETSVESSQVESALRIAGLLDIEIRRIDSIVDRVGDVGVSAPTADRSSSNHLAYHCMRLTAQPQPTSKAP